MTTSVRHDTFSEANFIVCGREVASKLSRTYTLASALSHDPLQEHELAIALTKAKRRSAPGADGITFQMLQNLDRAARRQLLGAMNEVWETGLLPEAWLTMVVVPIRKPGRPATAITSYRPVSLTSAAWAVDFLPEQQTGCRRHRYTADSIADVISTLEEARSNGEVALLILLDIQSAFDGLPHSVI
ncbi:hypothetical protein HPB49_009996 [Dermacentor silvarum]|uniref:Uncharacterized protein n=1 Tax=Dermacentor silvarum TaxID=543639 RepID=A0ACB8CEH6_DERSI|nr:hypothetical protein HPB49_009996 [Dermacentor silvarum]